MVPTFNEVMKLYRVIALSERMKTGRPCEATVDNALHGTVIVCRAAGLDLDGPVTQLTRKAFDMALVSFVQQGLTRVTAWSYVCQLRGVFSKWCRPYYKDAGWEIPTLEIPAFRAHAPRYVRPSAEMLKKVRKWYGRLTGEMWLAATMMLEFAMRNGDVLRLQPENFVTREEGGHFLSYTPHKTELSSGRQVYWPVHPAIWEKIEEAGGFAAFDVTDETFDELNCELRDLGFRGLKGAYELRKICIDHVYQKYGVEMAVSISGDDIKTITRYYADPAQPNVGVLRIVDLL